jgi:long-chain acyl-CoA synthetase
VLDRPALVRVIASLVAAEIRSLRPGQNDAPQRTKIADEFAIKDGPLALDSLEFMALATTVASFFGFFDTGREDTLLRDRTLGAWVDRVDALLQKQRAASIESAVTFSTSGTTGTPQRVRHPTPWLAQEVDAWRTHLSTRKRVVVACPVHHIYGFIWGALLPQALGLPVIDLEVESLNPGALQPGDLLVTVPTVWTYLANSRFRFVDDVWGISSTSPLPEASARAASVNGLARLLQIYGSTETAGVAWRDSPDAAYELLPFWHKTELAGQFARHCVDGEHRLFTWPDVLNWQSETRFSVAGRHDGAVQIGGHNVSTAWVRARILETENVAECAVRTFVAGAELRIKVFVVLSSDTEQARHDLVFALRQSLPQHAQPKHFAFGLTLPVNELGKAADWPL